MKSNLVSSFDDKLAEKTLQTCPVIVQDYVRLLKEHLEIQKSLTKDAIKKLMNKQ